MIFLFRNLRETVKSFMKIMISFGKYAFLFTGKEEMLDYWRNDLPLPSHTIEYRWAKDNTILENMSLPAVIGFNWCCTVACIKSYIEQGIDVLHLDYQRLI